jgi:hypothetical protein
MSERIEIIEVPEERQAPFDLFLGYLVEGKFATPASGQWREHDDLFHRSRIDSLAEDEVRLVKDAANVGRRLLLGGDKYWAIDAAEHIDRFLSNLCSPQTYERRQLEAIIGHYGVQDRLF